MYASVLLHSLVHTWQALNALCQENVEAEKPSTHLLGVGETVMVLYRELFT